MMEEAEGKQEGRKGGEAEYLGRVVQNRMMGGGGMIV